ncbi:MAG: c-type cytochrome biogenesis protein CcmI [Rhizobiales bacterium]|nr:c-type cytochrome biogenesis protein CcmI [Hyphomicrobiales bacterium]OJY43190.1 MAG: c-type cytochrome biogenesis protein CcmI [Rhizobiales bacterium 64-17]
MTLWFVFALMTAAAVFALLWPLGRRRAPAAAGHDVAVYRDQLAEIDRDATSGLISVSDADTARIEISRRLLRAADRESEAAPLVGSTLRRRVAALAALVLLPAVAVALYVTLGSPDLPAAPLAGRAQAPSASQSVASLVSQVEAHIERNPDDGRGWEVLAPVYLRLGRYDDAVKARARALALNGETADRQADLGEAKVAAANGIVTAEARQAFDRALALDPQLLKAKFYLGLAAEQDGKREEAASIWRAMLANAPADAPWIESVREALARIGAPAVAPEQKTGAAPAVSSAQPGPSADDMAAAATLTPQQRQEMVSGMVSRLADRLKTDGSDVEGWLRLMRAYVVLGERDRAIAATVDARRALAGDVDKLRRVDELAKGLGIDG